MFEPLEEKVFYEIFEDKGYKSIYYYGIAFDIATIICENGKLNKIGITERNNIKDGKKITVSSHTVFHQMEIKQDGDFDVMCPMHFDRIVELKKTDKISEKLKSDLLALYDKYSEIHECKLKYDYLESEKREMKKMVQKIKDSI